MSACDAVNGICKDTIGSYLCSCKHGFMLQADGKTCGGKLAYVAFELFYSYFTDTTEPYTFYGSVMKTPISRHALKSAKHRFKSKVSSNLCINSGYKWVHLRGKAVWLYGFYASSMRLYACDRFSLFFLRTTVEVFKSYQFLNKINSNHIFRTFYNSKSKNENARIRQD